MDQLNLQFQAARYRDWEQWAVLHEPPSEGYASRKRQVTGAFTVVEASVKQSGVAVGKKARWSLPLRPDVPMMVRFEIGPVGGHTSQVVVPLGSTSTGPSVTPATTEASGEAVARGAPEAGDSMNSEGGHT